MATLDFSKATASVDMTDANLVSFGAVEDATPTEWSFLNSSATSELAFLGQGMTFNGQGRALSGTVSSISIDVGLNGPGNRVVPVRDLVITGVNVAAATLDDGATSFWRFLQGNDVIFLPSAPSFGAAINFTIFGDGPARYAGLVSGGNDTFHLNGAAAYISGDVSEMAAGDFVGGADYINGQATGLRQTLIGDAAHVHGGGKLIGGSDNIFIQSTHIGSLAVGDADTVKSTGGGRAEVIGGNDYIAAVGGSLAFLVGDVNRQLASSLVRGGNDELVGAGQRDPIIGDVFDVGDRMVGGDDLIWGNGGGDLLIGDAYAITSGGKVVGGNDTIYGGEGRDDIYGDTYFDLPGATTGGNDELNGEEGDDLLVGGGGNDFLHGGTGGDRMYGGVGNDTYVIDSAADIASEAAGQGIDIVKSLIATVTLANDVENLTSLWIGNFTGVGNGLNNTMSAGGSADLLDGKAGNDVLIGLGGDDALLGDDGNDTLQGGAGADMLFGGDGTDTASYAGATEGVRVSLDGSLAALGEALGDTLLSIEALAGSDYRDVLRGNAGANVLTGGGGNDALQGGSGNDTLIGGAGRDGLLGGAGNDRFDFLALTDGGDTVAGFTNATGNNDTLRFEGDVFGGLAVGALAANRFVANAAGVVTTLGQRFVYETDTGVLRYDANGSAAGGVTVIATFTGTPTLSASDFSII